MKQDDEMEAFPISSWVAEAARGANLPALLLGPAGAAISRLIGGVTDIPAAWLEAKAAEIRSKTIAKSVVSSALADAASSQALKRDDLVEIALSALLPDYVRKRSNKESVAQVALLTLAENPNGIDPEEASEPHADWLNVFARFAEDASSERMQDLWGRVLAQEIRRRGSFSIRTLRFMAELDKETAEAFQRLALRVFDGDGVDLPEDLTTDLYVDVFAAEQAGLLAHGGLCQTFVIDEGGEGYVTARDSFLILTGTPGAEIDIPCAHLTKVGEEVLRILPPIDDTDLIMNLFKRVPRTHLTRIDLDRHGAGKPETLWSRLPGKG